MTEKTRRRFLGALATTAVAGAAGCLGGGGESTPTDETGGMEQTDEMGGMTETDSMGGMTETDSMGGMTETDSMGGMTETDSMGGMTETESGMMSTTTFEVTVTNVSEEGTITTSDGSEVAVPLSPTAYAVHTDEATAFTQGESASDGLESLAEDGDPSGLGEELSNADGVAAAGGVATPDGASSHAPLLPGDSYTFEVEAGHDHHLSIATMFVQSNDLFYAFDPAGLALFESGSAVQGEVTDQLTLWDAGTEQNQEPGAGPDQAPRQSGADTGPTEDASVRPISQVMDEYDYPDVSEVIEVTVTTM